MIRISLKIDDRTDFIRYVSRSRGHTGYPCTNIKMHDEYIL